ncbi:hypothetical protein P9869_39185 [Streptomyces ossamyceticus]|nr:hypothetical protein [Streptomyces ossamyceticus]
MEKDRLRAEFLADAQDPQLAESLGRSEKAVRWVLHRHELISFPADDVPTPRTGPEKPKAYTVADKRRIHPNAYQPWSAEDEQRLAERCAQGASLGELSRNSAAMRAASPPASSRSKPRGRLLTRPGGTEARAWVPIFDITPPPPYLSA